MNKITATMILNNLTVNTLTSGQVVSNAMKAFERKEWFKVAIQENRLTDFLTTLEQAINALPEGTEEVATFSATTGKQGTKKVNQRDIAKRSFSTAWLSMEKDLTDSKYKGKELKWKMSRPEVTDKVVKEKTLVDRLATLLDKTIDNKGLETIVSVIEREQARHANEVASMAQTLAADKLKTNLLQEIAAYMQKGRTEEQALTIASLANDMDVDSLKVAIA